LYPAMTWSPKLVPTAMSFALAYEDFILPIHDSCDSDLLSMYVPMPAAGRQRTQHQDDVGSHTLVVVNCIPSATGLPVFSVVTYIGSHLDDRADYRSSRLNMRQQSDPTIREEVRAYYCYLLPCLETYCRCRRNKVQAISGLAEGALVAAQPRAAWATPSQSVE